MKRAEDGLELCRETRRRFVMDSEVHELSILKLHACKTEDLERCSQHIRRR